MQKVYIIDRSVLAAKVIIIHAPEEMLRRILLYARRRDRPLKKLFYFYLILNSR